MSHLTPRWEKVFSNTKSQLKQKRVGLFLLVILGILVLFSLCSCSCSSVSTAKVLVQKENITLVVYNLPSQIKAGERVIIGNIHGANWRYATPGGEFMKDTSIYYNDSPICYRKAKVMEVYPLPKNETLEEKAGVAEWKFGTFFWGILFILYFIYNFFFRKDSSKKSAKSDSKN